MAWEIDWSHPENCGEKVWARNPVSHIRKAREWHWTLTGHLRKVGVATPTYRKDSWEVDWSKREAKRVWARNLSSKMPVAREWHWIDQSTLNRAGVNWKPKTERTGRRISRDGYVFLTRVGMTLDDIALAEAHGLFRGRKGLICKEHHLVAVKKFGTLPEGYVVRHKNGIKHDNRPENLLIGTTQENNMDHNTARLAAMDWHQKYRLLRRLYSQETGMRDGEIDAMVG